MKHRTKPVILFLILQVLLFSTVSHVTFAKPAIIGGQDAKPGEFPFLVALVSAEDDSQFCGGSLINKDWVLTAAHCFFSEGDTPKQEIFEADVKVKLGITDLTDTSGQVIGVTKIFQLGYDGNIHDIALLKLAKSAEIDNRLVATIKINDDPNYPPLATKALLAGWGAIDPEGNTSTDVLKKVSIPVITCESDVADEYVCAGDKKGKDACFGDSGGPLVVQQSAAGASTPDASTPQPGINAIQIGIVSFGGDKCFQRGAYTRTSFYKDWIAKTIGDNSN